MKLTPLILQIGLCVASSLIGMSVLEVSIASADSHPNLPRSVNALSYPRSGQRFIEKGLCCMNRLKSIGSPAQAVTKSLLGNYRACHA